MEKITLEINIIKALSELKLENYYFEQYSLKIKSDSIIKPQNILFKENGNYHFVILMK
jgi:hypothetical protein